MARRVSEKTRGAFIGGGAFIGEFRVELGYLYWDIQVFNGEFTVFCKEINGNIACFYSLRNGHTFHNVYK